MTLRTRREEPEQMLLAQYLDALGVLWTHPPNEGKHKVQYLAKRRRLGVKAGVPDVLVFTPPPAMPAALGAAIELKSTRGKNSPPGSPTPMQRLWLEKLARLGWATAVCHGAKEAIEQLTAWGYRAGMGG